MAVYEVEMKFPIHDRAQLASLLKMLGAQPDPPVRQIDRYYNHPSRDFAESDEALRIRSIGAENCMTYKGPLLDQSTKSRQEIEIPLASGAENAQKMDVLLQRLSFAPVRQVVKTRSQLQVQWQGRNFTMAIDDVDGLGLFLEIESIAQEQDWTAARDMLRDFAQSLGLQHSERRSYLQLLIDQDTHSETT